MLPVKVPRDPAPSRIKYRLERLWLRPAIRKVVKTGIPVLILVALGLTLVSDPGVQARTGEVYAGLRDRLKTHRALIVQRVEIRDASDHVAEEVAAAMALGLPASSLDVDIAAVQARIAALDIIETASVRLGGDGVLMVDVQERIPALVWRGPDGLQLVDATGVRVGKLLRRDHRSDLPLIAGAQANVAAAEALQLFALGTAYRDRIRGLVRVGARRWDVVLDRQQRVMLPEEEAVAALARIIALDRAEDLLARDITVVDLRDARRPTLRLSPAAWDGLQARRVAGEGRDGT